MEKIYKNYLMEYGYNDRFIIESRICLSSISFIKLRDLLIRAGTILKEDFDNKIYVVLIKSGWLKSNNAIVICGWKKTEIKLIGFAKEGLFNQKTSKKAIDKIEVLINE